MRESSENVKAEKIAEFSKELLENKKAENILSLKVSNISLLTDYFIICTGTSNPHLNALAEWLKRKLREEFNIRPANVDGTSGSGWIVVDFGNVIVHILSEEVREKYKLEQLWNDSEKLEEVLLKKTDNV
ncbi:MAG: ribosome silencing factor [Victivallales bacterium]|nr:ribosome silencing factor [Victivallales bacterium]